MFLKSIHGSTVPAVAFTAYRSNFGLDSRGGSFAGRSLGRGRGSQNGGRGRGCHPPHCQLCRTNEHYANSCPDLHSFACQGSLVNANLPMHFKLNVMLQMILLIGM